LLHSFLGVWDCLPWPELRRPLQFSLLLFVDNMLRIAFPLLQDSWGITISSLVRSVLDGWYVSRFIGLYIRSLTYVRQSAPVSFIAVAWMVFTTIVFFFPVAPKTNATSMNYTVVVLGGWIILSLVGYYFPVYGGYRWFTGPRTTLDKEDLEGVRGREKESGAGSMRSVEKVISASESTHGASGFEKL